MGDMGPRGAINMGGRDLKQKSSVTLLVIFGGTVHAVCDICISVTN